MIRETEILTLSAGEIAATESVELAFYFPHTARIVRYFAVPTEDQAAHASQTLAVTFVDAGDDGEGATTLATLTNATGTASGLTANSGAWEEFVAKELNTEDRPGTPTNEENSHDVIAAGSVIKVTAAKGTGATTGSVYVGVEYQRGS